jgi:hypothetical protein
MAQQRSPQKHAEQAPVPQQAQRDSFDPSGPDGGFGGAGGSQGSVYEADAPKKGGQQRREHEAWQKQQSDTGLHGAVKPGETGPYGDYGEVQGHDAGYWLGGRDKAKGDGPARKPSKP